MVLSTDRLVHILAWTLPHTGLRAAQDRPSPLHLTNARMRQDPGAENVIKPCMVESAGKAGFENVRQAQLRASGDQDQSGSRLFVVEVPPQRRKRGGGGGKCGRDRQMLHAQ